LSLLARAIAVWDNFPMSIRGDIEKRIEKKELEMDGYEQEIARYRTLVTAAQSYIQALEETLRILPREDGEPIPQPVLRPGTLIYKAREAILAAGKPLHVDDLLKAVGKAVDTDGRGALGGTLSSYVRKQQIFTRPAPNTFGLVELAAQTASKNGPPPSFGRDDTPELELDGEGDYK
jgi:hypothetical protein